MSGPRRVLVTGAAGNLGRKLVPALLGTGWCAGVVGVDRAFPPGALPADDRLATLAVDLRAPSGALGDAVAGVDAVVHLAAQNPFPDASWADAAASFDMTATLLALAARAGGGKRVVFASSNHVMGGWKDEPAAAAPGFLTTALPPRPGTRAVGRDGVPAAPPAYATAKLMGERLCLATAAAGAVTAVALRIGWCQPDDNRPDTITAAGIPGDAGAADDPQGRHDLAWFRGMWLSNGDFMNVALAALTAAADGWPAPGIVVNAMSDNAGMGWDIGPTRALLGYAPRDDVWRALGQAPQSTAAARRKAST